MDGWKVIRLGKLPTQFGWVALIKGIGHKEVELVGITDSRFIRKARADTPHVCQLTIDPADITALATDRADPRAKGFAGIVSLSHRASEPVGGGNVVVQTPKKFGKQIDIRSRVSVVILNLPVGNSPGCIGLGEVSLCSV